MTGLETEAKKRKEEEDPLGLGKSDWQERSPGEQAALTRYDA